MGIVITGGLLVVTLVVFALYYGIGGMGGR